MTHYTRPCLWANQDIAERLESIGIVALLRPSQNVPRPTKLAALPADAQTSAALDSKFWNGCRDVFCGGPLNVSQ
jgi:hypothetical protein